MQGTRMLPPMYLLIAMVAMVILHFLVPVTLIIPAPWNLLGVLPVALGIALNLIADGLFHKANTTVKPGEESAVLVTKGPFYFTRNPMYLGFTVVLIGVAALLGSLSPWIVVPVFAILIDRQF